MASDPRYPIGPWHWPDAVPAADRARLIQEIADAPSQMRAAVEGLDDAQLDTPYRDGGWTLRQVVHHLPDSHVNSYTRFRLALTEEQPTIRAYREERWAELPDARTLPPGVSLALLDALHERWVVLLRSMTDADFARELVHPEHGVIPLDKMLAMYAWHGRHHVAHVTTLRSQRGW
ncbi:MAG TPA: bacillithiol transferase BstA [Gemmatimonadales bacterium]|nr:bacillithiol transferase BstA [Gemmatimonadales bacterium]